MATVGKVMKLAPGILENVRLLGWGLEAGSVGRTKKRGAFSPLRTAPFWRCFWGV